MCAKLGRVTPTLKVRCLPKATVGWCTEIPSLPTPNRSEKLRPSRQRKNHRTCPRQRLRGLLSLLRHRKRAHPSNDDGGLSFLVFSGLLVITARRACGRWPNLALV